MQNNKKKNGVLSFAIRLGLSGLLLWYISTKIDVQKTLEVLQSADLTLIVWAGVIFIAINFILLFRWIIFIHALDLRVPLRSIFRYYFIGLAGNLFLPSAIGGDLIKIIGLCTTTAEKPKVVASVLLDRLSGFAGIVLVASISFIYGYKIIQAPAIAFIIIGMVLGAGSIATILFNQKIYSFFCSAFNAFPKIKQPLMKMHEDVMLLQNKYGEGIKAVLISSTTQVITAVMWYVLAKGLGQDIPLIYCLIFIPLICVASSFPSIGGLGVREAGAAYLFAKIGVPSGIAVSISLLNFIFMVLIGVAGGVVYVFTLSSGRVQHNPSDQPVRP